MTVANTAAGPGSEQYGCISDNRVGIHIYHRWWLRSDKCQSVAALRVVPAARRMIGTIFNEAISKGRQERPPSHWD